MIDCKDIQEQITAAVDLELDPQEQEMVFAHLRVCQSCRYEYEMERTIKNAVRTKVEFLRTPDHLREKILSDLFSRPESVEKRPTVFSRLKQFLKWVQYNPITIPAVGMALAALAIFIIMRDKNTNGIAENEILHQALVNYSAFCNGNIAVQCSSDDPSVVKSFLRSRAPFAVDVHRFKNTQIIGGNISEYEGIKLAHVMYKFEKEIVYVYQAGIEEILKGKSLYARKEILDAIKKQQRYISSFSQNSHDCSTVVWEERGILCSAISTLPKNEMLAMLNEPLDPD